MPLTAGLKCISVPEEQKYSLAMKHVKWIVRYPPSISMRDQLDNDLNNILQRLNIIMKSVGGNTRHTSIISDPFLDLRHKMSKKLKEAYEILDEIQSYSRSTKHMTISMTKKSELRELISELTVDLEKLQAWLRTEQSKRKSKFSDDELTGRALDITNMEHDIQAIRDRQKIGYIRMHAGSGHGAIEMSTSRDLAMRIQRPSTAASNTSISCGGALNTTPLTDEQKSQLKSIRQRDEDMGVLMDGIEEGAMNLRYVAIAQNEEVKLHSIMLDEVGVNMDSAQDKVTNVNRRLQVTLKKHFEEYQRARVKFVQAVAEAATRPQNIEVMNNAGVMQLLRPLLLDNVPSIQQTAALALGRLANYSEDLAEGVVGNEILPQLVYSLSDQNRFYKKAAAFVLRAVAKHSPDLAQAVVDSNALETLVPCLEEFDPTVKEAAAWAIGYIAQHTPDLAQHVVDAGAVPLMVLCIQEPEITLKRIAASAMSDICKHSPELAQAVVDAGAVAYLAPLILHPDAKLKRQVCGALSHISKHSVDLAEVVVEAEIFPNILNCLKDSDVMVRKNAAMCVREVAKHTPELAKLIVNSGGAAALVDYVSESQGNNKLPGIMALGYISAFSETLALATIVSKGIAPLKDALVSEPEDHIKAACAWTLGQIGRHTPDHARAMAEGDVLRHLLACMVHEESSEDLKTKAKRALKAILSKCTHLQALQPLLRDSPVKVQKYVLRQFSQLLPHDVEARRSFVQSGGLQFLQELNETVGGKLSEYIVLINNCYPPEVVEYYSPNYSKTLLQKVDEYQPSA